MQVDSQSIGPIILTTGPWKPVYLEAYSVRIDDLRVSVDVNEALNATTDVSISLSSAVSATASIVLKDSLGAALKAIELTISNGKGTASIHTAVGEVDLWWPVKYGKQALYTVEVSVPGQVSLVRGLLTAPLNLHYP